MKKEEVAAWFSGRLPQDWASGPIEVVGDRDELIVTIPLSEPVVGDDATEEAKATAREARISGFREDSRDKRMKIANEAQRRFGRTVSWAAKSGTDEVLFTHLAAPAMTRLRLTERKVLDTLVESGVARSRADALAWCVRLVGKHESDWLAELRDALGKVREVRQEGPAA
jgi:hypothetical protein